MGSELFGLPVGMVTGVVSLLGLPGLLAIMWYIDSRRMTAMMGMYEKDMSEQRRMYEDNVRLVKNYEKVAEDLLEAITMSTQATTRLLAMTENNMYCPIVRQRGEKTQ